MLTDIKGKTVRFPFSAVYHSMHVIVNDVYIKSAVKFILCSSWCMSSFISFERLKYIYVQDPFTLLGYFWFLRNNSFCLLWPPIVFLGDGQVYLVNFVSRLPSVGNYIIQECPECPALWMHS